MTAPKYVLWGVFRLSPDAGYARPVGPLQITRRAAEADIAALASLHDVHDAVVCEVRITPKDPT